MKNFRLPKLNRIQFFGLALATLLAFSLLAVGGFSFAAAQEENDSFCASCHTQPESTYFERSLAAAAVDLASAHRHEETRCIDCHSGIGLLGRISAQLMGAQNAAKWYTGTASQPAPLLYPLGDDHCVKCHQEVLTEKHDNAPRTIDFGPKGHYHDYLAQWREIDQQAAICTSCHSGHNTGGSARTSWVNPAKVQNTCEDCHALLGSN